jgi:regulatory protein
MRSRDTVTAGERAVSLTALSRRGSILVIVEDNAAPIFYQFSHGDRARGQQASPVGEGHIDGALIERWALAYLGRFASSAENLRRVLLRRVRRRLPGEREAVAHAAALIDALVARYRQSGLVDDAAYAAGRARSRLRRGQSLRTIRAGLATKGVGAEDAAAAIAALQEDGDPDLAAAGAFARRRRLGPFRRDPGDRNRELGVFARAGFTRAVAEAVLDCTSPEEVEALSRRERG